MSGEDSSSQVLLASDGRQMNPSETIGAYSITASLLLSLKQVNDTISTVYRRVNQCMCFIEVT